MPSGGSTHLLIPALGRQRQGDFCDFKVSLVYRASYRTARTRQRNLVSKTKPKEIEEEKEGEEKIVKT